MPRPTINNPSKHPRSVARRKGISVVTHRSTGPGYEPDLIRDRAIKRHHHHECAYPGCEEMVKPHHAACDEHWALLTPSLKSLLRFSIGMPDRREVMQQVMRYYAIRARLRELAS